MEPRAECALEQVRDVARGDRVCSGAGDIAQAAAAGTAGAGENPELVIRQTVDNALVNAAKGTMEQLQKNRKERGGVD